MNELTTNVSTHALLLKDGSKKFINQKAYDIIWNQILEGKDSIMINDWYISIGKIGELISMEEYRQRFPNVREDLLPAPKLKTLDELGLGFTGIIEKHKDNKAGLKGMIKGMKHFLSDKKPGECKNAEGLLELMELKLNA
jgi:hypothetical protein